MALVIRRILESRRSDMMIAPLVLFSECTAVWTLRTFVGLRLPAGLLKTSSLGLPSSAVVTVSCRPTLREQCCMLLPVWLDKFMRLSILLMWGVGMLTFRVRTVRPWCLDMAGKKCGRLMTVLIWLMTVLRWLGMCLLSILTALLLGPTRLSSTCSAAAPFELPGFRNLRILLCGTIRLSLVIVIAVLCRQAPCRFRAWMV